MNMSTRWMMIFVIVVGCGSDEALPGEIICGEGTKPHGEGCIPVEGNDTGDSSADDVWD